MEEYTLGDPVVRKKFPTAATIIAATVIIILAGGWLWYVRYREVARKAPNGWVIATAQPGQVISGFPSGLIPEKGISVQSSYNINTLQANQPVVTYISAMSLADNLQAYKNYFAANGWRITSDGSKLASPYIYAVTPKYTQEANVSFASVNGKVQVTVSVLNRSVTPLGNGPNL